MLSVEQNGDTREAEVEGSDTYQVEVTLKNNKQIEDYSCDCPSEADPCKHIVAALFAIREEIIFAPETVSPKPKSSFEELLNKIDLEESRHFIRQYAKHDKEFKTSFELFFSHKDTTTDPESKYKKLVQSLIKSHSDGGYVHYRDAISLARNIEALIDNGSLALQNRNFNDAFSIIKGLLRSVVELFSYSDDSSGSIGGTAQLLAELLTEITSTAEIPGSLEKDIYDFLQKELTDKTYFNYGDLGHTLFDILVQLAGETGNEKSFLAFIDTSISKLTGEYDKYEREFFLKQKIGFLQKNGKEKAAVELINQHMDVPEIRMTGIERAIANKDFKQAEKLINEGIGIAKKDDLPGVVTNWEKQLLRIAKLEKRYSCYKDLCKKVCLRSRILTGILSRMESKFQFERMERGDRRLYC